MWLGAWASFLGGFAALVAVLLGLGWKLELRALRGLGVISLGISLPAFLAGAISSELDFQGVRALVAGALMTVVVCGWMFHLGRSTRVASELFDPERRGAALDALKARMEGLEKPKNAAKRALEVIDVSRTLIEIGEERLAAEWLAKIDPTELEAPTRATASINLAVAYMNLGELGAARIALSRVPPGVSRGIQISVDTTDAFLRALDGRPAEALQRVAAIDRSDPVVALAIQQVSAIAHASLGETERARAILVDVMAANGPEAVHPIIKKGGAAASIARDLLEQRGSPYR